MSRVYVAAEKNIKNAVVNNKKIVFLSKNKKYKGNKF